MSTVQWMEACDLSGPVFEPLMVRQAMNRVQGDAMPFSWSLNPYRGCSHGCAFCYARSTHEFLGHASDDSFRTHIFLKTQIAEALDAQLSKMLAARRGNIERLRQDIGALAIGTATDPYQAVEGQAMLTRACLEVLANYGIAVSITTRSPLILRDLDLLRALDVRSINLSIHTVNKTVWKHFEPATSPPEKRFEVLGALREAGIPTGVFIAPIIPFVTDSMAELMTISERTKAADASFVMMSVMRLSKNVKPWFMEALERFDPARVPLYKKLYLGSYPTKVYRDALKRRIRDVLRVTGWPEHGGTHRIRQDVEAQPSGQLMLSLD